MKLPNAAAAVALLALPAALPTAHAQTPYRLRDLVTDPVGSSPADFVEFNAHAYFTDNRVDTGRELWRSDGTTAGTARVADIRSGPAGSRYGTARPWLAASATHLLFQADDGIHGSKLWALELLPGARLPRRDVVRFLDPLTPARATVWPLEPARDGYRSNFVSGESDPDEPVLGDRARPLIAYAIEGAGLLKLSKSRIGQVRIYQ